MISISPIRQAVEHREYCVIQIEPFLEVLSVPIIGHLSMGRAVAQRLEAQIAADVAPSIANGRSHQPPPSTAGRQPKTHGRRCEAERVSSIPTVSVSSDAIANA